MGLLPPVVATLLADTKEYSAKMDESIAKMEKLGVASKTTGERMTAMGGKAASGIVIAGATVLGVSVKMAATFQTLMTTLVTGAGESQKNIDMVSKGILNMAGVVGQTPAELAKGMYLIESAGYHGAAGLKVLKASAEGAAVGGAQMATVAGAVTTALHDYHIPVSRANAVTSALVETVASGKTNLQDLSGSLGKVMPVASALGINFQTVSGAMATMTNAGLSARFASMHLANTLLALSAPSKTAQKAMASVGINAQDLKSMLGNPSIGLAGTLQYITDMIGKKFPAGSVEAVQAMKNMMGGATGFATALMLGGKNAGTFTTDVKNIGKALNGSSTQVQGFSKVKKDLQFQLHQLGGVASSLAIKLGTVLLPKISVGLLEVGKMVTAIQNNPGLAKLGGTIAEGLFSAAIGFKIAGYGIKFAEAFGLEMEGASLAGPIGAAIALGILAVIKTGNGKQAAKGLGQIIHPSNILSPIEGAGNIFESLFKTVATVSNAVTKDIPIIGSLVHFINAPGMPPATSHAGYGHSGAATIHHRVTVRVTR